MKFGLIFTAHLTGLGYGICRTLPYRTSAPGWETSGQNQVLLEEVLVRPARAAHPVVYVGPNPQYSDGDTILSKKV